MKLLKILRGSLEFIEMLPPVPLIVLAFTFSRWQDGRQWKRGRGFYRRT